MMKCATKVPGMTFVAYFIYKQYIPSYLKSYRNNRYTTNKLMPEKTELYLLFICEK